MTCCPLCTGTLAHFADGLVLLHHSVSYQRCLKCGSLFLVDPVWLDEAYSSAISTLDVGLLNRCRQLANVTTAVIGAEGLRAGRFLDFAGGFGTLTRLMRDRGLDFRHYDPMCDNVFAQGFEGELTSHYALITAFEVLEHLPDPAATLQPLAEASEYLLMTTQVLPEPAPLPGSWEYFAEETGQHITFYTERGLRALADQLGFQVTTAGGLVHLFHRGRLRPGTRALLRDHRVAYLAGAIRSGLTRHGLTIRDRQTTASALRASSDRGSP